MADCSLYCVDDGVPEETPRFLREACTARDIDFVTCEGTGDRCSELKIVQYRNGEFDTRLAARCNPHGRWIEWLL